MTDKEKAIEALKEIGNVIEFSDCGEWDYNVIKYTHKEAIEIMAEQLNQSTLDDAIAVVEKMKNSQRIIDWKQKSVVVHNVGINNEQYDTLTEYEAILEYEYIFDLVITALKGLKEGK